GDRVFAVRLAWGDMATKEVVTGMVAAVEAMVQEVDTPVEGAEVMDSQRDTAVAKEAMVHAVDVAAEEATVQAVDMAVEVASRA
ncbi:MAG: hypothetical protein Q9192_007417, partial [Flavoplaca navasiana]